MHKLPHLGTELGASIGETNPNLGATDRAGTTLVERNEPVTSDAPATGAGGPRRPEQW